MSVKEIQVECCENLERRVVIFAWRLKETFQEELAFELGC